MNSFAGKIIQFMFLSALIGPVAGLFPFAVFLMLITHDPSAMIALPIAFSSFAYRLGILPALLFGILFPLSHMLLFGRKRPEYTGTLAGGLIGALSTIAAGFITLDVKSGESIRPLLFFGVFGVVPGAVGQVIWGMLIGRGMPAE